MTPQPEITDALLPCPFCGSAAELGWHSSDCFVIRCSACAIEGPAPQHDTEAEDIAAWNTRHTTSNNQEALPHGADVEIISEAIYDFLDKRFPEGALPGGVQLFADDHLDAEFKHEAGCDEMTRAIVEAIGTKSEPASGDALQARIASIIRDHFVDEQDWRFEQAARLIVTEIRATNTEPTVGVSEPKLKLIGYWSWHPDYGTEFSEQDITNDDRAAGWASQPTYVDESETPTTGQGSSNHE